MADIANNPSNRCNTSYFKFGNSGLDMPVAAWTPYDKLKIRSFPKEGRGLVGVLFEVGFFHFFTSDNHGNNPSSTLSRSSCENAKQVHLKQRFFWKMG